MKQKNLLVFAVSPSCNLTMFYGRIEMFWNARECESCTYGRITTDNIQCQLIKIEVYYMMMSSLYLSKNAILQSIN